MRQRMSEPRGRVPVQQVEALLNQLVEQFPDRNVGLAMANHHHMTDTHVLGLTAIASATGLDALRRLVRYQALVSTQEPFTITEDAETVTLSKTAVHGDTAEHLVQVFVFAVISDRDPQYFGLHGRHHWHCIHRRAAGARGGLSAALWPPGQLLKR